MATSKFKNIGIVIKHKVEEANQLALELSKFIKEQGLQVSFASEAKDVCSLALGKECSTKQELVENCDVIVVLGGDGTFLSVARLMEKRSIPVMGINMGTLGFLTDVKKSEAMTMMKAVIENKFRVSKRILLECSIVREGKVISHAAVVNDAVVTKAAIARIIEMRLTINQDFVALIKGDGLIIGTPAGSTAYSLAAGGPIIKPSVPALTITPICPHSLTLRPLVVDDQSLLEIEIQGTADTIVTWDGQEVVNVQNGDILRVKKLENRTLDVIQAPERNYFSLLREKLKYGFRD